LQSQDRSGYVGKGKEHEFDAWQVGALMWYPDVLKVRARFVIGQVSGDHRQAAIGQLELLSKTYQYVKTSGNLY
jgi:hypothetical protein